MTFIKIIISFMHKIKSFFFKVYKKKLHVFITQYNFFFENLKDFCSHKYKCRITIKQHSQ